VTGQDLALVSLLGSHALGLHNKVVLLGSACQNTHMSKDEEITKTSGGIREGNRLEPFVAAQISTKTGELHKHSTREASLEVLPLAHIPFKLL